LPRNHVDQRSGAPQRAVKGRCYVIGVNPAVHADQIPANFPDRERVWRTDPDDPEWVEPGNAVIVGTNGEILAGPARHTETVLVAELDLTKVLSARRLSDPVGPYHRPDVLRLAVDTAAACRHHAAQRPRRRVNTAFGLQLDDVAV
jgi:nitrilase